MNQTGSVSLADLLAGQPAEPDEAALLPQIKQAVENSRQKLVVVDDDPTGVQTVHDVTLLTTWDEGSLAASLQAKPALFFILTNSRSLPEDRAAAVNREVARSLKKAANATGSRFVLASRSDSTLRGHYPAEIIALEAELGPFDGHLLIPAFFEGGRYTVNDTHYVATPFATSDTLIPANQTPFAADKVFGYRTAYLPGWVVEKSAGRWKTSEVMSISLELIRQGGPEAVARALQKVEGGKPVIINAAGYGDLAVVVLGLLEAEARGKRFLYRTAAGFVRIRGAVEPKPLLQGQEILGENSASPYGGLVVVGSYVPGSSAQLERLVALPRLSAIELAVEKIISSERESARVSLEAGQQLQAAIETGKTGLIFTSRRLVTGSSDVESLEIGRKVSQALLAALKEITTPPRFIIAKGGITSHEVAQKALGAEKARAIGQLLPGVPIWRLESGPNLKFKGVPYIVFPGNVGGPESLAEAVQKLSRTE